MQEMPSQEDLQLLEQSVVRWLDSLECERLSRSNPESVSALWDGLVKLGLCGLVVEERWGGANLGLAGIATVIRQIGRRCLVSPLVSQLLLAADLLSDCGGAEAEAWLESLTEGARNLAVVDTLAPVRVDLTENTWRVRGTTRFVANTSIADGVLLVARHEGQLVLLQCEMASLTRSALAMIDGSDFAHLEFHAEVPAHFLGELKPDQWEKTIDRGRVAVAMEMLGLSEAALEVTAEYLRTREQFGQKIGGFQALQHRMAKAYIKNEIALASIEAALSAEAGADFGRAATIAKVTAGEALHLMSRECIQLHGGIGMTDEHIAGHYLKRARVLEEYLGNRKLLLERYAEIKQY